MGKARSGQSDSYPSGEDGEFAIKGDRQYGKSRGFLAAWPRWKRLQPQGGKVADKKGQARSRGERNKTKGDDI